MGEAGIYTHAHILTPSSTSTSSCTSTSFCSAPSLLLPPSPPSPHLTPTRFTHPPAANIIQPLPGNKKCKLTMLTQVDPGGFAPPVLINHVRKITLLFSVIACHLVDNISLSVLHCYSFKFQRFALYFFFSSFLSFSSSLFTLPSSSKLSY